MVAYLITAIVLVLYLVLGWFVGTWLHLHGAALWTLRALLWLIGLAGTGAFVWFYRQRGESIPSDAGGVLGPEIDQRVHEARARLRAIHGKRNSNFGDHTLVMVMGPAASTKTTVVRNCGLDPDLLSGLVEQDGAVVPTRSANLFYTRDAVFVDAGGGLLEQPGAIKRLLVRLQPNNFSRAIRGGQQSPRVAVVCVGCDAFQQGGQATAAIARRVNTALQDVAQVLGSDYPVYVVFTKMDRLPGFTEYVQNLTKDEATQILGATLPLRPAGGGVYAEVENNRLTKAFDELFCSLAEHRIEFLARESDGGKLGSIYEFPREMRKLRAPLVQFLVDLCRPTQMPSNPFLRGFYFCGVRPLVMEDVAPAAAAPLPSADPGPRGATRMFSYQPGGAAAPAPRAVATARKVPQWAFVPHLLTDVVLRDRVAMAATNVSANVSVIRRLLLAAASVVLLAFAILLFVSYGENRALERSIENAAQALPTATVAGVPSVDQLRQLDTLRASLQELEQYRQDGAPWHMRFGLYAGDSIYPEARTAYFARFNALLFATTQGRLLQGLQTLPAAPDPAHDFSQVYDTLKSYLITTTNHEHSSKEYLAPVLMSRYSAGVEIDAERSRLIQAQFEFYSTELKQENPYTTPADDAAVARGRTYLKNFADEERVYQAIISDVSSKQPAINFNRAFPGSGEVVVDSHEVPGAFTKTGYASVQDHLRDIASYLKGEEWVVGPQAAAAVDIDKLRANLSTRYRNDFLAQWRAFLKAGNFLGYRGLGDAASKLSKLASPGSPMLELFSLVATNTAVPDSALANAFQAPQAVVPPDVGGQYIQPSNQPYVQALTGLQTAILQVQASQAGLNDAGAVAQALSAATGGVGAVNQVAQRFKVDPEAHVETVAQRLLAQPFDSAIRMLQRGAADDINSGAADFCSAYDVLMQKFPMNPGAQQEATLDEFNNVFAPGKKLWQLYDTKLSKVLLRQGNQFVAASGGSVHLTPEFVRFFNSLALMSESLYPAGATQPRMVYSLRESTRNNVPSLSITIDGETLTGSGNRKQFNWPGTSQGLKLASGPLTLASFDGVWGVFHFMSRAQWTNAGGNYVLEFPVEVAGQVQNRIWYETDAASANVFNRKLNAGRCVRFAAR